MRITDLQIKDYRSLKDVHWKPGTLNVLIGPNASGKSNLLKFLRLINASARGDLNNQVLREGGMGTILWDGRGAGISFVLVVDDLVEEETQVPYIDYSQYAVSLRRLGTGASFVVDGEALRGLRYEGVELVPEPGLPYLWRTQTEASYQHSGRSVELQPHELTASETLLGQMSGPTSQSPEIKNFRQFLGGWAIYDDLHTESDTAIRRAVTARFDERLEADGQNLASVLHTHYANDTEFKDRVDEAMRAAFGRTTGGWSFRPPPTSRYNWRFSGAAQSGRSRRRVCPMALCGFCACWPYWPSRTHPV